MKHKPLLRIALAVTACLWLLTACGEKSKITMTTQGTNTIEIRRMYGTGVATIDWGDGKSDTCTLPENPEDFDSRHNFTHNYSTATTHTVTITGNRIIALSCHSSNLTALDVRSCKTLEVLFCPDNQLTSLDVSQNTALRGLICNDNQLTSLNVSSCVALTGLYCSDNQLMSLEVSGCAALTELDCSDNQLTTAALNALFGTLPNNMGKKMISINSNPGAAACNQSIATTKGWTDMMAGVEGIGREGVEIEVEEEMVPIGY